MFLTQYRLPLQEQAKWARSCLNEQAGQSAAATVPVPHAAYAGADLGTPRPEPGINEFSFSLLTSDFFLFQNSPKTFNWQHTLLKIFKII